jgi:hypothetical protein
MPLQVNIIGAGSAAYAWHGLVMAGINVALYSKAGSLAASGAGS